MEGVIMMREESLYVPGLLQKGASIRIEVDGEPLEAFEGQTIAAALIAAGRHILRHTPKGSPRGIYCGMGDCFDCLVEVDGEPSLRSCITPVRAGMRIRTPGPFGGGQ